MLCVCCEPAVCLHFQLKSVTELSEFRKAELRKAQDNNNVLSATLDRVRDEAVR